MSLKLTAENVEEVVRKCLPTPDELSQEQADRARSGTIPQGYRAVKGVVRSFLFSEVKIAAQRQQIADLLGSLPNSFHQDKGGGWSFLNACMTEDGRQWGEHRDIDDLLCLGIASNMARIQFPPEMWDAFPGGLPYFVVNTKGLDT